MDGLCGGVRVAARYDEAMSLSARRARSERSSSRRTTALVVAVALLLAACSRGTDRGGPGRASGQWPGGPPHAGSMGPAGAAGPAGSPGAPGAPGPGGGAPAGDPQRILDAHNRGRAEHCAAPLQWSADLAMAAQRWANTLAQRGCALEHSSGPLGENLAAGTPGTMTAERAVDLWMQERAGHDFRRGGFSMATGHFTQVVWKSTQRLGCASATCQRMQVWVCNYDPPGNMEGDFQRNVGPGCAR